MDTTNKKLCIQVLKMSLDEALKHIGERKEKEDEERKDAWLNQREN